MGDEEEYDFQYSDESEQEPDVEVENTYYEAKGLKEEDPEAALEMFKQVVSIERDRDGPGEWGFKALKQSVKLLFGAHRHADMLGCYRQLLDEYMGAGVVTQNMAEQGIDSILDHVSSSATWALLQDLYDTTLARLAANRRSERLWFKTNLKLGHLLRDKGDVTRLTKVVKELLRCCEAQKPEDAEGADVIKRGTQLLEVYALQIQMHSLKRDTRALRQLYSKAMHITWGIPHPRTLAVMSECGGKMFMAEKDYDQAIQAFFQSFKSYDEAGDPRRLCALKYLVLASMLHKSTIDPFDSQEAKPYKTHPEIVAMCTLISAFQANDVRAFENILKVHQSSIMSDDFIRAHIDDLLRTVRSQVLLSAVAPYRRVSLNHLSSELNKIPEREVEALLVDLILDGRVNGHIDQVQGLLIHQPVGRPATSSRPDRPAARAPPTSSPPSPSSKARHPGGAPLCAEGSQGRLIRDFTSVELLADALLRHAKERIFTRGLP